MGHRFGIDIFYSRSKIWDVIDSVVELDDSAGGWTTTLTFGGQTKVVPWWLSDSKTVLSLDGPDFDEGFCLSIPCVVDDKIREYINDTNESFRRQNPESKPWEPKLDGQGRVYIGCIYLSIVTDLDAIGRSGYDADLVGFEFHAATVRMGRLFYESEFFRKPFLELAKQHDAVYCLVVNGACREPKPVVLWLDGRECQIEIDEDWQPMSEVRKIVRGSHD